MPHCDILRRWRRLIALDLALSRLEAALLIAGVLGMAAVNLANVVGRNLFDHSLSAAAELNRLLIVLVTFVGIGYAARLNRHIRMTALSGRLGGRTAAAAESLTLALTGGLLLWLAWLALGYVLRTAAVGSVTPALGIPLYLVYAVAPLGLLLGGLQFLGGALRRVGQCWP